MKYLKALVWLGVALAVFGLPLLVFAQNNYVVDEAGTTIVPENGMGPARMSTNKIQYVNPTGDTGTALFPAAFSSANNIAARTATAVHGFMFIHDGTDWDMWNGGVSQVGTWNINNIAGTITLPTGAATSALQDGVIKDGAGDTTQANVSNGRLHVDGSGVTQSVSGTVNVGTFPDNEPFNVAQIAGTAPVAHDAAMSGDSVPLTTSCYSESPEDNDGNTNGNRVSADAEKVRQLCSRYGEVFVREGGVFKWTYHENSSSALTDTTVHASCGSGLFNYITSITASIGGATAFSLLIEESTTTTILGPYYLEAISGRGFHLTFPGGRKQTTSATLVSITTTGAVAHGIDVQGFCAH